MRAALVRVVIAAVAAGQMGCAQTTPSTGDSVDVSPTRTRDEGHVDVEVFQQRVGYAHQIAHPASKVWDVLRNAYARFSLPITRFDPAARVIAAEGFEVRRRLGDEALSRIVDCGRTAAGLNANTYTVWLRVVTRVVPIDSGSTTVRSEITGSAVDPALGPAAASRVPCTSTGWLEERIALATREMTFGRD
jgi:hypothetical protein